MNTFCVFILDCDFNVQKSNLSFIVQFSKRCKENVLSIYSSNL